MHFKQFYLGCLAHASYLVGDDGECAVVDPQRDVDAYLEEAAAHGLTIKHVIETHLHADFVSGHIELARRTGATIHVGRRAGATYDHHPVGDGDELVMGQVRLRFLETPGHTPESLCVLVYEGADAQAPSKVLTGDTLFIGDVGRPDLVSSKGYTSEDMAGMMYDSLRDKIMTLPDEVEVFPAHGAGSACGRNISSALSCTIGTQKELNHALQPMSREAFVALMTTGLAAPPRYFPHSAELNRQGARPLDELGEPAALTPEAVEAAAATGAVVLDVRSSADFAAGHVPGALNIGLDGNLAPWVGNLVPVDARVVLVTAAPGQAGEAARRLARVGYDDVAGVLDGGVEAWRASGRAVDTVDRLDVDGLAARLGELVVLDVRRPGEHEQGHVPGAVNIPVHELEDRLGELDPGAETAVVCETGYRSSAAVGLLARHGFGRLHDVVGGTAAWRDAGRPVESAAGVG